MPSFQTQVIEPSDGELCVPWQHQMSFWHLLLCPTINSLINMFL